MDLFVNDRDLNRLEGLPVHRVFEDGFDAPVRADVHRERTATSRLQALDRVSFPETYDTEAGTIAEFGMLSRFHDFLEYRNRKGTSVAASFSDP